MGELEPLWHTLREELRELLMFMLKSWFFAPNGLSNPYKALKSRKLCLETTSIWDVKWKGLAD